MQRGPLAWVPYATLIPLVPFAIILVFLRDSSTYLPMLIGLAFWTCLYALAMELDIIRFEEDAAAEAKAMRDLTVEEMTERLASADPILGQ